MEGKAFLGLDIGLPVDELAQPLRACLADAQGFEERILHATNRRGRPIRCRVTCTRLVTFDRQVKGVIILMEEWAADKA